MSDSSTITEKTTLPELAAIVSSALTKAGIQAFLSGGAVVSIYTENKYESFDLDFITIADRKRIKATMESLDFRQDQARLYRHPKTKYMVEFPGAAMMVGDQPIKSFAKLSLPQGTVQILTPTDCVKDRLAAFYHWNDRQALDQAVWVAQAISIKLEEVRRWSKREGALDKFQEFSARIRS